MNFSGAVDSVMLFLFWGEDLIFFMDSAHVFRSELMLPY